LVRAVASECLPNVAAGHPVVAASVQQMTFEPRDSGDWDAAFACFDALV
jgi:hypothetical protein